MAPPKSCDHTVAAFLSGIIPMHSGLSSDVLDSLPFNNPAEYAASDIFEMDTVDIPGAVEPLSIGTVDMLDQEYSNEAQNELWPSIESSSLSELTRLLSVECQTSDGSEVQSLTLLHDLNQYYFQTVHRSFPIIDQTKFLAQVAEEQVGPELLGLRYAMWAHAAALLPAYSSMSGRFYQQARESLERPEMDGSGGLLSIAALQLNVLLALYELEKGYFMRAWVSAGRATWLAQMLELHKMDGKDVPGEKLAFQRHGLATNNPEGLEERRKTFWAVNTLNCFLGVCASWNISSVTDYPEITTLLPVHDVCEHAASTPMTLEDALKPNANRILSPYQANIVAATLCSFCISHVKQVHRKSKLGHQSYDFWTQHHRFDEAINVVSAHALAHLAPLDHVIEPHVLSLNVTAQATIICLHQAVISMAEKTRTSTIQLSKTEEHCTKAAIDIATKIRLGGHGNLVKTNPFVPWAVFVALQVLARRARRKSGLLYHHHSVPGLPSPLHHADTASHPPFRPSSSPVTSSANSDHIWIDARALDSMHFLLSYLTDLEASKPLARVFKALVDQELVEGDSTAQENVIGLVNLPIAHPNKSAG